MVVTDVAPPDTSGRQGIGSVIESEWIKFRSVRSTLITLLATFALCVGIGALICLARRTHFPVDPTRASLQGFTLADVSIGVIGVLIVTAEYSSGLIRATLAATPRRPNVLVAKALVLFVATTLAGEACAFASFLTGQAILSGYAPTASLTTPAVLQAVLLAGLSLGLLALVAMGIGLMLRHTAGSIAVFVSLLLVVWIIVAALPSSWNVHIYKWLPEVLTESMRSTKPLEGGISEFTPWVSTIVLSVYAVVALIGGAILFSRRDA
jgi:ABC-type transport system involved in multi-copper enzyme maturation permease subunit